MRSILRAVEAIGLSAVLAAGVSAASAAQSAPTSFRARLTPVPVESSTAASITGSGTITATVDGSRLSLAGSFAGMKSPATIAQVHFGARGVRGPVEFDLTVDNAPSGSLSGSATLSKSQLDSLRKGWFYVQIHAEKAPEGNLWGWLLPA
jgi:hypothetical protein